MKLKEQGKGRGAVRERKKITEVMNGSGPSVKKTTCEKSAVASARINRCGSSVGDAPFKTGPQMRWGSRLTGKGGDRTSAVLEDTESSKRPIFPSGESSRAGERGDPDEKKTGEKEKKKRGLDC